VRRRRRRRRRRSSSWRTERNSKSMLKAEGYLSLLKIQTIHPHGIR
jgi:hypothetical protein